VQEEKRNEKPKNRPDKGGSKERVMLHTLPKRLVRVGDVPAGRPAATDPKSIPLSIASVFSSSDSILKHSTPEAAELKSVLRKMFERTAVYTKPGVQRVAAPWEKHNGVQQDDLQKFEELLKARMKKKQSARPPSKEKGLSWCGTENPADDYSEDDSAHTSDAEFVGAGSGSEDVEVQPPEELEDDIDPDKPDDSEDSENDEESGSDDTDTDGILEKLQEDDDANEIDDHAAYNDNISVRTQFVDAEGFPVDPTEVTPSQRRFMNSQLTLKIGGKYNIDVMRVAKTRHRFLTPKHICMLTGYGSRTLHNMVVTIFNNQMDSTYSLMPVKYDKITAQIKAWADFRGNRVIKESEGDTHVLGYRLWLVTRERLRRNLREKHANNIPFVTFLDEIISRNTQDRVELLKDDTWHRCLLSKEYTRLGFAFLDGATEQHFTYLWFNNRLRGAFCLTFIRFWFLPHYISEVIQDHVVPAWNPSPADLENAWSLTMYYDMTIAPIIEKHVNLMLEIFRDLLNSESIESGKEANMPFYIQEPK
jgi:hypothetical protein